VFPPPRILADANGCAPLGGNRAPNFVLVDYVNLGDPFTAAAQLNNLPLPAPAAQPSTGDQVADAAQGVADSVKGAAESAGDAIKSGVSSLGDSIKGLFGRA
jgi:hypothetical protein